MSLTIMRNLITVAGWAAGLAGLTVALGLGAVWAASEVRLRETYALAPETVQAAGADRIFEGRRLAKLYGCSSCHGAALQGQVYNDDPSVVRPYAPNLTRVATGYSDEQLAQAIRQGVRPTDGRALWGMPSATFAPIDDAELSAVLAWIRSLPVAGAVDPDHRPSLRARWAVLRGAGNAPEQIRHARLNPAIDLGPALADGRHIALTVCSECHGSDLGGDAIEGGPDLAIVGGYDLASFTTLMRTGIPIGGRDLGLMSETAREDLRVFSDAEIERLHAYLHARALGRTAAR